MASQVLSTEMKKRPSMHAIIFSTPVMPLTVTNVTRMVTVAVSWTKGVICDLMPPSHNWLPILEPLI